MDAIRVDSYKKGNSDAAGLANMMAGLGLLLSVRTRDDAGGGELLMRAKKLLNGGGSRLEKKNGVRCTGLLVRAWGRGLALNCCHVYFPLLFICLYTDKWDPYVIGR